MIREYRHYSMMFSYRDDHQVKFSDSVLRKIILIDEAMDMITLTDHELDEIHKQRSSIPFTEIYKDAKNGRVFDEEEVKQMQDALMTCISENKKNDESYTWTFGMVRRFRLIGELDHTSTDQE